MAEHPLVLPQRAVRPGWLLGLSIPLSWLDIFQLAIVLITGVVGLAITYISFRYPSVDLNGGVKTIAAATANGKSA